MTYKITNREIAYNVSARHEWNANSSSARTYPGAYPSEGRLPNEWCDTLRFDAREVGIDYIVYSYGTPIAWVTRDGEVTMPDVRYSVTTSKTQNYVRQGLGL